MNDMSNCRLAAEVDRHAQRVRKFLRNVDGWLIIDVLDGQMDVYTIREWTDRDMRPSNGDRYGFPQIMGEMPPSVRIEPKNMGFPLRDSSIVNKPPGRHIFA